MSTSLNTMHVRLTMIVMIGAALAGQALAAEGPARFSPALPQPIKTSMPMGHSAKSFMKFNQFQVNSKPAWNSKINVSANNSLRLADRFVKNKVHIAPDKISGIVKKGPKLNPILVNKLDPGKSGGAPPLDPGKGNGPLPAGKGQCKMPCKWPCFPHPCGLYPFGCYPYGYFGGFPYFGCGVNNYNSYSQVSYAAPSATSPTIDLALEDVRLVQAATPTTGPVYRVTFRNMGTAAAGAFRVGAIGTLDGQLSADNGTIADVAGLAAGETASVSLRLPVTVMQLTSDSSTAAAPYTQLAVAVDVDNVIAESAKDNNVGLFDRASIDAR